MKNKENPLKAALAKAQARASTVEPKGDVVISAPKPKAPGRDRGHAKTLWLFENELSHLEEVELFCRNHRVKADASKLMRAALTLLKKDDRTLDLVRETLGKEGR